MRRSARCLLCALTMLWGCASDAPAEVPPEQDTTPFVEVQTETDAAREIVEDIERSPEPPTLAPPRAPGGAFIDLSTSLDKSPPFEIGDDDVLSGERAQVTAGLFVDLDADGREEVILSVIPRNEGQANQAYALEGNALSALPQDTLPPGTSVLAEDLDGDGHPDLLSLSLGSAGPLFWGDGQGGWSGPETLGGQTLVANEKVAVSLVDLDQDGWLDLLAEGYCQVVPYFKSGPRSYLPRPHLLQGVPTPSAYAVMGLSLPGLGTTLLALGNVTCDGPQESVFTVVEENSQGYPLFAPSALHGPNPSWAEGLASEGLESLTYQSPMGAAAGDLDGDGLIDLFIPLDPVHALLLGQAEGPPIEVSDQTGLALLPDDGGAPMLGWGSAMVDLDRDGRLDLVITHGDDGSRFEEPPEEAPPMFTSAHLNLGDLSFTDLSASLGLERRGRWRALSVGDPDRDGDPDLVVGGVGELPRVYLNELTSPYPGFSLRLRGRVSNHLGVGARVEIIAEGLPTQTHYVGGVASPNVVSPPIVFVGLGAAQGPVTTRVHWPSGLVQEAIDLAPGTMHVLTEPEVLTLDPITRHIPADGESTLTLTLTPQDPASTVALRLDQGLGTLSEVVSVGEGVWQATLRAPSVPASARVEVLIDGEPLRIRPRIWFDLP